MGNPIILIGIFLVIAGIAMNLLSRFGLPHLPGDIIIRGEHGTVYLPIATSVILSIIMSILLNLFR